MRAGLLEVARTMLASGADWEAVLTELRTPKRPSTSAGRGRTGESHTRSCTLGRNALRRY